ncbi:MAG: serine/threonine-protein kinase, partial [Bryobacteraceae bacterium]
MRESHSDFQGLWAEGNPHQLDLREPQAVETRSQGDSTGSAAELTSHSRFTSSADAPCETIPNSSANAVMQCPSCASRIPEGSRFCFTCGAAMPSDASVAETVAIADTPASTPTRSQTRPSSPTGSSVRTSSEGRFLPGDLLAGRYRVVALLGKGGMGEVYRADDLALGQPVALKFLPESLGQNPASIERFRNEVRLARLVSHPHVCRVYDVGEVDGHPFLSMEYVDGEDLASLLRRIGRLPSDKALEIARGLCAGLAAAHDKGILHRDLKPGNVMIDGRGQVLLTDFGLAGIANEIAGNEVRNGTPLYMAPEQLAGKEVTVRSDIYSLGLLLYELFTGKPPFEAATLADLARVRSSAPPLNPSALVRDMDPAVERVILRCLEADPAARPASALAVAAALPGGDPLAAALAAGETPSPEMVAAAGEGTGLRIRVAVPLLAGILIAMAACIFLAYRSSALQIIQPDYSPDVLAQKARDIIQRVGYGGLDSDEARGFNWEDWYLDYRKAQKGAPNWDRILRDRPPVLRFWYRQSPYPMTAIAFHDDRLTPGIVDTDDPPRERSGMINVFLDHRGRLVSFEAIPPQLLDPLKQPAPLPDWAPLFAAAELDPVKLEAAEPLWTFQATSDARTAWTGVWPGTSIPLRVEAASLRGRPTAFVLFGPWIADLEKAGHFHPDRDLDRHCHRGVAFLAQERGARPGRPSRRATARIVHRLRPDGALGMPQPLWFLRRLIRQRDCGHLHQPLLRLRCHVHLSCAGAAGPPPLATHAHLVDQPAHA